MPKYYRMWRGWIYFHAWAEVKPEHGNKSYSPFLPSSWEDRKGEYDFFSGICDTRRDDMDRDLSEMNWFGYAGGLWLFPKLGEAWVDQMLTVAGNRLDLGEGRMCWERQTVLRLLKKKKKKKKGTLYCKAWIAAYCFGYLLINLNVAVQLKQVQLGCHSLPWDGSSPPAMFSK